MPHKCLDRFIASTAAPCFQQFPDASLDDMKTKKSRGMVAAEWLKVLTAKDKPRQPSHRLFTRLFTVSLVHYWAVPE